MSFGVSVESAATDAWLVRSLDAARGRLQSVAEILEDELLALAREKASGIVLQVRSGAYLRSIRGEVRLHGDQVTAVATSDAPGAGFLEYGGVIPAHDILPTSGQALRFLGPDSGAVYAAVVHDPGAKVAPHSVLHASIAEMRDAILGALARAGGEGWS